MNAHKLVLLPCQYNDKTSNVKSKVTHLKAHVSHPLRIFLCIVLVLKKKSMMPWMLYHGGQEEKYV